MRIDNDGEGGILSADVAVGSEAEQPSADRSGGIVRCGPDLWGWRSNHACDFGVVSAGRAGGIVSPGMQSYILPLTVLVLILLFAFQYQGTARIGKLFGPIMLIWFVTLGVLGLRGIAQHPSVLVALNPVYGARYLLAGGGTAFAVLGAVFLCVTGAEALYADMGHFLGVGRFAWRGRGSFSHRWC